MNDITFGEQSHEREREGEEREKEGGERDMGRLIIAETSVILHQREIIVSSSTILYFFQISCLA